MGGQMVIVIVGLTCICMATNVPVVEGRSIPGTVGNDVRGFATGRKLHFFLSFLSPPKPSRPERSSHDMSGRGSSSHGRGGHEMNRPETTSYGRSQPGETVTPGLLFNFANELPPGLVEDAMDGIDLDNDGWP